MDSTSSSLLERLRQPNQAQAWARFVELYTPLLLRWARRAGLPPQDAADFTQEVFALLLQKLPQFTYDPARKFRAWLRTLALNKWRDLNRRRPLPRAAEGDPAVDEVTTEGGFDSFWEAEHRQHLVRRALEVMQAEFQPTTWQACWECVVNDRSAAEVGTQLGLSEGAVYVAKSRVLRKLRQELAGLLD
jgi:RNA polymerase sigma-70 factor (ECF subfamily)